MNITNEEAAVLYRLATQDRLAFQTLSANRDIDLRIVCFHGQQAVEKAIKAVLVSQGVTFPTTHDLNKLVDLLPAGLAIFPAELDTLRKLNPYAVVFRYDDREIHTLTRTDANTMVEQIFAWAEALLG
jgi:HEPN domain-containing protein